MGSTKKTWKRNTAGLKPPWQKGQSGNPTGRPKKRPVTDEYFALADQPLPEKVLAMLSRKFGLILPKGTTFAQMNSLRRWLEAIGLQPEVGGTKAAKEIREAMEGKAPMRLEISGPERKEITLRILHDRTKPSSSE